MKTIDCKGLNCPEPVLKTKQTLEEGCSGELTVIVDSMATTARIISPY